MLRLAYMTNKALTHEEFLEKCSSVHGDKYDYSLSKYVNQRVKLTIICGQHGAFTQTPNAHLSGNGCPLCANHRGKYTMQEFVEVCKKTHGGKYDYSSVTFKNLKCPIVLSCSKHGKFQIQAFKHKNGRGCPKCHDPKKPLKNRDKVIADFNKVHSNKYNYDKMIYKGSKALITVTCLDHGDFYIVPNNHLAGMGCPVCSSRVLTREEVVNRFRAVHGLRYDYSEMVYKKSIYPVKIICRTHGAFEQQPDNHWSGSGCPTCARNKTNQALKKRSQEITTPLEKTLEYFKDVHGDVYDYSLINTNNYKTLSSVVPIKCSIHGVFLKACSAHKKGRGCPECAKKLKDQNVLIQEFRWVHGERYGYEKVEYVGYAKKVKIICKIHGPFFQTPASHLQGAGCSTCSKSHSQENIIKIFKKKHGDKYGYERVVYISLDERVEIYCNHHKEYFWQTPSHHKRGSGCTKCCREKALISQEEIIKRFKAIHGERYDYSETVYVRAKQKLKIKCRTHGDFWQLASDHTKGRGCPTCSKLVISAKAKERMRGKGFGCIKHKNIEKNVGV